MNVIRVFVIGIAVVCLAVWLTGCLVPSDDQGAAQDASVQTGDTGRKVIADSDTALDDPLVDGAGNSDGGELTEETLIEGEDDATTDTEGPGDVEADTGSDQQDTDETDASASEEETEGGTADESETSVEGLNPYPPDGGMWSFDELGKMQNEKILVMIETDKGNILLELYPELAPKSVEGFLAYVNASYYEGVYFHRIIKDFVVQGGCALTSSEIEEYGIDTKNWPAKVKEKVAILDRIGRIEDESNYAMCEPGTVALAKIGYDKDTYKPDSARAQFFINIKYNEDLDKHHTVFGKITAGMDIVLKLSQDDIIRSVRVMN